MENVICRNSKLTWLRTIGRLSDQDEGGHPRGIFGFFLQSQSVTFFRPTSPAIPECFGLIEDFDSEPALDAGMNSKILSFSIRRKTFPIFVRDYDFWNKRGEMISSARLIHE